MSGGTQQAPTPYQPQNQQGADQSFQQGAGALGQAGQSLYGSVAPAFQTATSNVINNPYYNQAQQGAQGAAQTATSQVAPQQLGAAQGLQALSNYGNPAALQTLYNAYDPQKALYNQGYQQNLDQQNAIQSMSGTAGSPYGAGLTSQSAQNFNTNWQNQQLARQIAALGAFDTNLGAAGGAATTASNLGTAGLNTMAGAAQLPQDIYLQQQQANIAALQAQVQGTTGSLAPTQMAVGDQGQYLNIGQTATQGAQTATQINNKTSADQAAGIGNLFGDVLGMFAFG